MSEQKIFWDGLYRHTDNGIRLIGWKCKKCGRISFPKDDFCTSCLGDEFEEIDLPDTGTLYSYTLTCVPVEKYSLPHPVGMIDLDGVPLRLTAILAPKEEYKYKIGSKVKLVEDVLWVEEDGMEVLGYKFKTVSEMAE